MDMILIIIQFVIAFGILNVWILRFGRATNYRGGHAQNMKEEFAVYGLPAWSVTVIGAFKILLAILLIIGVWIPELTRPAAIAMAILMVGAVTMHFKVRDSIQKALPAAAMLLMCLVVASF